MRVEGPGFRDGWNARLDVDGAAVVVEARHRRRNRLPTAHEFSRQAMRGRGRSMVEAPEHEWAAPIVARTVEARAMHAPADTPSPRP